MLRIVTSLMVTYGSVALVPSYFHALHGTDSEQSIDYSKIDHISRRVKFYNRPPLILCAFKDIYVNCSPQCGLSKSLKRVNSYFSSLMSPTGYPIKLSPNPICATSVSINPSDDEAPPHHRRTWSQKTFPCASAKEKRHFLVVQQIFEIPISLESYFKKLQYGISCF